MDLVGEVGIWRSGEGLDLVGEVRIRRAAEDRRRRRFTEIRQARRRYQRSHDEEPGVLRLQPPLLKQRSSFTNIYEKSMRLCGIGSHDLLVANELTN
ncbi:hypothetical protein D1007_56697 [Hordeum vulgare]|nr:hypothetical protein D1007_56697 [Hordeum vulgare]